MKTFQGRVVAPGRVAAEALVSHGGLNTLASFQKALQFGDKKATCGDQNNPDLYGKQMAGKALCLPLLPQYDEDCRPCTILADALGFSTGEMISQEQERPRITVGPIVNVCCKMVIHIGLGVVTPQYYFHSRHDINK